MKFENLDLTEHNSASVDELPESVQKCVAAFKAGKPVLVFDSAFRERETDLLFPAGSATPQTIRTLRKECGGLLFLAIGDEVAEAFGLPFLQDLHTTKESFKQFPVLKQLQTNDLLYDNRSAFTLSLNHRKTYTGITDEDRALTTRRFAELYSELKAEDLKNRTSPSPERYQRRLGEEFRTPGHIPVCRETKGGLKNRQGHTELAVCIARLADLEPCTIGAEMLMPNGDKALPVSEAKKYGELHNIPFVTGDELLKVFKVAEMHKTQQKETKLEAQKVNTQQTK